jgi:hypothetical protein
VIFLFAVQTFWLRVFNQQLSSISNTHNFVVITVKQKFAITLVKISLKRLQAKTTKPRRDKKFSIGLKSSFNINCKKKIFLK